jgi:hypothetical protein
VRRPLYLELLQYLAELENYAINRWNDSEHEVEDPAGYAAMEEELRAADEWTGDPEPTTEPPLLRERLAAFASGEVDHVVSLARSYALMMDWNDWNPEQWDAADYLPGLEQLARPRSEHDQARRGSHPCGAAWRPGQSPHRAKGEFLLDRDQTFR